ncbi:putative pre-mRNA-splicing factor ATP-dependent RNA helicase [Nymphaea thermarum]|nr:putative pre-mRNA-splicing factor ATP-dependent RNA helicase [Nymphaea thermarum]
MELPILKFEEEIVETVRKNSVVVLIGETGSGKSTQLSQILHRHGYTKSRAIGITQPRRVAAVSVSRRVASELGVTLGEEVGYAIRFEDRTSQKTCIKYLTDGVLLRESLSDPELNHYSVIILDEAHERSLNTDILLGLMKRLIKVRPSNLKVLITSATLDGAKVSKFFSGCPVLTIPGKLFPVEIHYSKGTPTSYLEASIGTALGDESSMADTVLQVKAGNNSHVGSKLRRILSISGFHLSFLSFTDVHVREPPGDILLFMTGQDDIDKAVKKLEERVTTMEEGSCMDAIILPLHGSLPPEMQASLEHFLCSFCYPILV